MGARKWYKINFKTDVFKNNWIHVLILLLLYTFIVSNFGNDIFKQKFDKKLISRYFLSQDITHEVLGRRLFLSDSDVYTATGYLYAHGFDPSKYNFEHPPFIKYLFGISTLLFNNPLVAQFILGSLLLASLYVLGLNLYRDQNIAFLAGILLLFDPLFIDVSRLALLDIGQALLAILYFSSIFFNKKNYVLQGVLLGLFAGTKFWVSPLFFVSLFFVFLKCKKQLDIKVFILHLIVAFATYLALYTQSYILQDGKFNIIWHILRTFKYRIVHNDSMYFGASLVLFLTGFSQVWWGTKEWIKSIPWNIVWPVGLTLSLLNLFSDLKKRDYLKIENVVLIIPILYLLFLGVQAPFPRYFLIILPFLYLVLAKNAVSIIRKMKIFK